ncbi:MAG: lactate racemase domain-containing protein [Gaiellaceae bacterium]
MPRLPLLAGTRLTIVNAPDNAVVLRPPMPERPIDDVGAATRDALRFPLAGQALETLATRGGRATIVAEPPALPIPGSASDPRQESIAATVDELVRVGVPLERQTILVATGLGRRPGHRDLEHLVSPDFARRFHGSVEVHDAEAPDLAALEQGRSAFRVHRALVETDLVVVVSAAETVLHGGPAALLGACGAETVRGAGADSLLHAGSSSGWAAAVSLEGALAGRVPLIGVSLALGLPILSGALRGYPYDSEALERIARSPLRRAFSALPGGLRARVMRSLPLTLGATAAFAGPPSVAHAEALIRTTDARSAGLDGPLDAICIAIPRTTPHLPRERPNPLLATYLGLGLALRLWRDAFPVAEGGTAILVHRFHRHFTHPTQQPYRAFFQAMRGTGAPEDLDAAERAAAADERAISAYRSGRTCHPRLPFADWAACTPALGRLGAVLIAGCRDATAAKQLGFVPTQGVGAALAMAEGRAGRSPRVGFLLSPPYFPLRVRAV